MDEEGYPGEGHVRREPLVMFGGDVDEYPGEDRSVPTSPSGVLSK